MYTHTYICTDMLGFVPHTISVRLDYECINPETLIGLNIRTFVARLAEKETWGDQKCLNVCVDISLFFLY